MTDGVLREIVREDFTTENAYNWAREVRGLLTGQSEHGRPVSLTSHDSSTVYTTTIENQGTGGHLNVPGRFSVNDAGTSIAALAVINNVTIGGTLAVTGATTLTGLLTANGGITTTTLTATGNVVLGDNNAVDNLVVTAVSTFIGQVTIRNTAPTTLASFEVTAGSQVIKLGNQTTPQLMVDVANTVVLFGAATPLASASDDLINVVGGAIHIASATAVTPSIVQGWRYGAAGTTFSLWIDAATNPMLIWKDDGGVEVFRLTDSVAGGPYQAIVTGGFNVTGPADFNSDVTLGNAVGDDIRVLGTMTVVESAEFETGIVLSGPSNIDGNGGTAGQLRIGGVIVGAANFDGTEEFLVNGQSRLKGATEITTGGLLVTGGAAADTFNANGTDTVLTLSGTTQTRTTVGAAGGASALPATPAGYIKIVVGGNDRQIPYYLAP